MHHGSCRLRVESKSCSTAMPTMSDSYQSPTVSLHGLSITGADQNILRAAVPTRATEASQSCHKQSYAQVIR